MAKKTIEHKAGDVVKPRQKSLRKAGIEIVYRPLSDLHPNPKNPRKATPEAIKSLSESLNSNPGYFEMRPVLLSDRTGELVIIDGEQRTKAAKLLGWEVVPTILKSGLTEAEEDEILIKGNSHAGEWDNIKIKAIAEQWGADKISQWGGENNWKENIEPPQNLDAPRKNAPFVVKITFPDARTMTKFVGMYKNELESSFGCLISESGGEL